MKAPLTIVTLVLLITTAIFWGTNSTSVNASGGASIKGKIVFEGTPPNMKVLNMAADPKCVANSTGEVRAESLVLGTGQSVANIFVKIKSGLPGGKTYTAPAEPVVVDQKGCRYIPHMVSFMKGQTVKIKNSDGTLHNVHGMPQANAEFNVAMPAFKKVIERKFDQVEDPFKVKCDVHPWMVGYFAVMDHPYHAVTGLDGSYTISGLEPGEYEVEIWHEKLGVQSAKVTVAAGEAKEQNFTLKKPEKVGQLNSVMIVE